MTSGTENVGLGFMVNMVNGNNQIVIGSGTNTGVYVRNTSKGPNSAKLGNERIDSTFLFGNINLYEYGLGNKEASDLSKTGSGYFLEVATDGTLIESTVTGGTAQTLSFDDATRELSISSGNTVDLSEGIQDEIAATITAGTGITVTYDDGAGTLEIAAPAGSGNTDEQTLSINEATAELTISNGNTVDLSEAIDNQVNTLLTAGDNISLTYNDVANTLTVTSSGSYTNIDKITFNDNTAAALSNVLQYNPDYETFVFGSGVNNTPVYIGQDMGWFVKNETGTTIAKGTPVYASGTDGNSGKITVAPMIADGSVNAKYFLGVTAESIANGANGFVWTMGKVRGVNMSAFNDGDVLYVSPTVAGTFTSTTPQATQLKLPVGFVVSDNSNGTLAVRATVGNYISESHDVQIASATNGDVLKFDGSKWVNGTDLVNDADADPNNEIQDLSLSGNTLSLSGDASTVDLSGYLDDQTVSLTGAGITAISGTYPNFTITSTEVDGSTTNEIQDLSLSGTTLSLTGDASTVDLSGFLQNTLSSAVTITGNTNNYIYNAINDFQVNLAGAKTLYMGHAKMYMSMDATELKLYSSETPVNIDAAIGLKLNGYGAGNKDATDLSKTASSYIAGFATDGTVIDVTASSLQATASNGLTKTGSNIELGGTLTKATQINLPANGSLIMGDLTNAPATALAVLDANNTVVTYGTAVLADYGSNNKEASDLSVTPSNYKAAFATDGTLIEVSNIDAMVIACSDETTDIATGTAKVTFRAPFAMTITGVRVSLTTASSSGNPTVDINESGTSILGTKLTIDANEKTSTTAATAATITDTAIADDAEITIDIDAAGTGATGLKVTILYRKN